jgi:23S rRNA pseudouridine2605 synthase
MSRKACQRIRRRQKTRQIPMPRKKSTKAESGRTAETTAQDAVTAENPATEPGDDVPKPRRKAPAKAPAKKPAAKKSVSGPRKKRGAKAGLPGEAELSAAEAAAAAEATAAASAEAKATAADAFEDAFEANDVREARATGAAAAGAAIAQAEGETAGAPQDKPAREPDEANELEGDWESGSGDEEEQRPESPPAKQERLQKILAAAGVASRRHAEELIVAGRVQVNGQVVTTLGSKADPARDHIRVDGKLIHGAERLRYFALNKPRGYVTTVSDPEGRPTVMEFFARMRERLYPVGRLDFQSEGLLLMTNDGELANQLTRAASGVEKVYLVKVAGQPDAKQIEALRRGVRIDRGQPGEGQVQTAPAHVRQIRRGENPWFEVGLTEGRNRELRKMFEEIGHHVEKIRRVGYGPLELDVEPGKMRELTPEEVQALRLAAEGKLKPKRIHASAMLPKEAGRSVDYEAPGRRGGKPARGGEARRGYGGAGQKWQDRGKREEGRRGVEGRRERREFPNRDRQRGFGDSRERSPRREGQEDRGGFAPRRPEFQRTGPGSPGKSEDRAGFGGRGGRGGERGGGGRGFDRNRRQGSGNARPQGQRPFGARPASGERRFGSRPEGERPRFEGRPPREGFEDPGSRPARGGFRPQRGSGPKPGGFRPERTGFRPERGNEQRRGQGGGFGQRIGGARGGSRRPESPRTGPGPQGGGSGSARRGPGPRGGGEGNRGDNRGGFGRKPGPSRFGRGGRPGGYKGRRG